MAKTTYREAGVDTKEGERAVSLMKEHVAKTMRPGVLSGLGGFGSLFEPDLAGIRQPVLVAGTDGVGTKLKLAFLTGIHDTVGIDCVAMCVNDVLCQGAEPLFFLDYLATGKLRAEQAAEIVKGVAEGCRQAGCALVGGETAEMPGFYPDGEYDLAGFAVGMADREKIIDGASIRDGDVILGLASSGLHSNGFSLVRKLMEQNGISPEDSDEALGGSWGEALLTPTRIYVKSCRSLLEAGIVKGMAHITGGGFYENAPRMLPEGLQARIRRGTWPVPPVFECLARLGGLEEEDLFSTFNMGIGLMIVVSPGEADRAEKLLRKAGEKAYRIGTVEKGEKKAVLLPEEPLRITVMVSGAGSNLQALLDGIREGRLQNAEIVQVISDNEEARALERAVGAGIPAEVVSRKKIPDAAGRTKVLKELLEARKPDLILLAGYLSVLDPEIVSACRGRILNLHPSLLPKYGGKGFFGRHVHEAVLAAGEKETGVTVHFVDEGIDTGEIFLQKTVPVREGDTPESLAARVREEEHRLLIQAVSRWREEKRRGLWADCSE